jgi:hypothetical protein
MNFYDNPGMFEMDRKIRELEHAMTANDAYLQEVEALNAELLAVLTRIRDQEDREYHPLEIKGIAGEAIAKAEGRK